MKFDDIFDEKKEKEDNKKERSKLSLEGGKKPFSIYTRRIIDPEELKNYLKDYSAKGLCGTQNLGNMCYMNSVITSLINCNELIYYFIKGDYKKDINNTSEIPIKWNELINKYWIEETSIINPEEFKDIISQKYPQFNDYRQQDANEFLISLLNSLNDGLKSNINYGNNDEAPLIDENKSDKDNSKIYWNYNLKINDSIITDLFCGQLKQNITCSECGETKQKFEFFNILNLPIDKKENNYVNNFQLFYVPKYGIRRTIRIVYKKMRNETTFAKCFDILKKEDKFLYKDKIDKLIINKTSNKRSQGFIDNKMTLEECNKNRNFYFCYDLLNEKQDIKIPIYLKKEGDTLSQYPIFIFLSKEDTLDNLRLKIYYIIRKYFYSPLKNEVHEVDHLTIEIYKYIKNKNINDEPIIKSINEEYKLSFKSQSLKDKVKLFIENIPFTIYLFNNNNEKDKMLFTQNFIELSDEIKEKTNINNFDNSIQSLLDILNNYSLLIEFNFHSEYINKYKFNLNIITKYICSYEEKEDKKKTLEECFKNFIKEEKLDKGEEWDCFKCKKKVNAKKKIELYYLPKIFIICFTRFNKINNNLKKNQDDIDFKIENLDMKEYMIGPDKEHSKYNLFAIIQHYGTIENGHYTSICKNNEIWYKYDDSKIYEIDIKEAQNSNAYILFYRRQTD